MEIDLCDYTPKKRQFIKSRGNICVYAIAPGQDGPTKIGYAVDLVARFVNIQNGNWQKLRVYSVTWCVGTPVAARLEQVVHERLVEKKILGEWFDINPTDAAEFIRKTACEIYPTMTFFDHATMLSLLKSKPIDKRDHAPA